MIAERITEALARRDESGFAEAMDALRGGIPGMSPQEVAAEASVLAAALPRLPAREWLAMVESLRSVLASR
jgi:hypothetical protein